MKLIVNNLGKFLVVALVVALVLTFIVTALLPGLRSFASTVFIKETNYEEKTSFSSAPTLSAANEHVEISIGDEVNLFENITAQSKSGADLSGQLTEDYAKAVDERTQVFVYKINPNKSKSLAAAIDTSCSGDWVVFYLVKDGRESAILKVSYAVV